MKRRVLFLVSTTEAGGAEVVIRNLIQYADRSKVEPLAVSLGFGHGDFPDQLSRLGIPVTVLPPRRLRNPVGTVRTIFWLRQFLLREKIDVVISNGAHPQVYGALAAWLARKKSVWYVMLIPLQPLRRNGIVDQLGLRLPAQFYVLASEACLHPFLALFPKREKISRVVYHGYDPARFPPQAKDRSLRQEFKLPDNALVVSLPARLQRWKGQEFLVRAVPAVLARFPQTYFVLVGGSLFGMEPDFPGALQRLAGELGVADHVILTGHRGDVPQLLADSDVYVHGSIEPEPGANALIEAMAMGKAIVATNIGCAPELVGGSDAGRLVVPQDASALAEAINELLGDSALRRRLGDAARARAQKYFSAPVMARKMEEVLETL